MATLTVVEAAAPEPFHRLFARHPDELSYASLADPGADESFENMVCCDAGVLLARVVRLVPVQGSAGFTGDTSGLLRVNLPDRRRVERLTLDGILPSTSFIRKLIHISGDGRLVQAIAGNRASSAVRYEICEIDLGAGTSRTMAPLQGIFF